MYTCMYVCMFTCIYITVHVSRCSAAHATGGAGFTHVTVHNYIYIYIYIYIYTRVWIKSHTTGGAGFTHGRTDGSNHAGGRVGPDGLVHRDIYTCIHTYIYVCMYILRIYIHTYIHTYIYTYIYITCEKMCVHGRSSAGNRVGPDVVVHRDMPVYAGN
jgi:hypothetical protein